MELMKLVGNYTFAMFCFRVNARLADSTDCETDSMPIGRRLARISW